MQKILNIQEKRHRVLSLIRKSGKGDLNDSLKKLVYIIPSYPPRSAPKGICVCECVLLKGYESWHGVALDYHITIYKNHLYEAEQALMREVKSFLSAGATECHYDPKGANMDNLINFYRIQPDANGLHESRMIMLINSKGETYHEKDVRKE